VAEEATGQPFSEPTVEQMAAEVAKGMLEAEEGVERPRDEKGKFTKAEAPAPEAKEEAKEESPEEPQEEPQEEEIDWDKIKTVKRKLTVKNEAGEDEEAELTLEEMEKGVMLERAFRMKTAQIARERESLQAKIKEAVEPKLKEYDEKLQMAEQAIWHTLAPEIQNVDWNKLAEENPAEWAKRYQHVQNVNAKLAQIQTERKKIAEAQQEEMRANLKKQAEASVERLKEVIPNWSNDLYGKILKSAVEAYGFKSEEANAITDHRAIEVLYDAMQYRQLKAKPLVDKRAAPAAPKVVKPGAGEKPDASANQWNESMANLRKSGRTEDAVAVAKLMLAREAQQQKR
jgi:hypothetical protein